MSAILSLRLEEEPGIHDATVNSTAAMENQHHNGTHEVYAVLLPWFVQALGIIVFYVLTRHLHALPYTALLFVLGMLMGVGASSSGLQDQLTESIKLWTTIDSEVLFTVFLPGLLFKDALEINFHLFWASIWQLLSLAFPLVLAGTVLTALFVQHILPYSWSFNQALTLGSILAATDPVAVASLLNEVGAPPRLKVHISGESLLNDGSAVVFFIVFGGLFLHELGINGLGQDSTVGEAFAIFFRMSLGGFVVGLAFAAALIFILYKLDRRMDREEIVLQVTSTVTIAYLSFYTSEVVCEMSGVIAVVTCGITTKAFGGGMISDWKVMDSFWSLLEHLLNSLIFALGGIEFGKVIARDDSLWQGRDWGYLVILYLFVNILRFFLIFAFFPINSRIGLGTNWQEAVFMSWGGLRGAVGITLALALDNAVFAATTDEDVEKRIITTKMFGMVGGVALLTLIINGTSCGPVIKALGLAETTETRKQILDSVMDALKQHVLDEFIILMTDERFFFVDFALVKYHCPLLRDLTAKELDAAVQAKKDRIHPDLYEDPHLDMVRPYLKDVPGKSATLVLSQREFFESGVFVDLEAELRGTGHEKDGEKSESSADLFKEDEEACTSSADTPALLKDMRIMFIELLRAAYQAQIQDGELDAREHNGFLVYALFQSLDFAEDDASRGKELTDWELSQVGHNKWNYRVKRIFSRAIAYISPKKKTSAKKQHAKFLDMGRFDYQKLRLDVLRALSFIDAHREAEDRLHVKFSTASGDAARAFRIVINESRANVQKANLILESQNKHKLKHVISHYLCTILHNKAARYVQTLADAGVLFPRESSNMLEHIDHAIIDVRKCPLDKHPDSLNLEGNLSSTQQTKKKWDRQESSVLFVTRTMPM